MKKIIICLLVVSLIVLAFAGCKSQKDISGGNSSDSTNTSEYFEEVIDGEAEEGGDTEIITESVVSEEVHSEVVEPVESAESTENTPTESDNI